MSLPIKDHSVTVAAISQTPAVATKVEGNPVAGSPSAPILCLVEYAKPSETYQIFGVETNNPIKIFIELSDAASFPLGCEVTWNGLKFATIGDPEIHSANDICAHAVVYAEGLQHPRS